MLADLLAGHGCRNNRDGRRTIRRRTQRVKTFFRKFFSPVFRRFFAFSHYSKSSSSTDFHKWKFHARTVEKLARDSSVTGQKIFLTSLAVCKRQPAARPEAARA
jgi:hypothetical protein